MRVSRLSDDAILRFLYRNGFRISAQDLVETRMDREGSFISVVVRNEKS